MNAGSMHRAASDRSKKASPSDPSRKLEYL